MKKLICLMLAMILALSFYACEKDPNKVDLTLNDGEMMLTGKVTKVSGNLLTFETDDSTVSDKFYIGYSDKISVAEDGAYVVDYTADAFKGKKISVICSELVQETYPAGLTDVRMIIIK